LKTSTSCKITLCVSVSILYLGKKLM